MISGGQFGNRSLAQQLTGGTRDTGVHSFLCLCLLAIGDGIDRGLPIGWSLFSPPPVLLVRPQQEEPELVRRLHSVQPVLIHRRLQWGKQKAMIKAK